MKQIPSAICIHDDNQFLSEVIKAFQPHGEVFVFVSRLPWSGDIGDWQLSEKMALESGATVVLGDWVDESSHRQAVLLAMQENGVKHFFIPDSDEIPEPELLRNLAEIAESDIADIVRVRMQTYWKTTSHIVSPPEQLAPILMLNAQECSHEYIREYSGGKMLVLSRDHGLLHHLSYVGSDERIHKKISTWGHKDELVDGWWQEKWLGWDADPTIRDLHPTHPNAFHMIERIDCPALLADVDSGRDIYECPPLESRPTVEIVIPLYGGGDDIFECLRSLEESRDLFERVIVVDDAGSDDAAERALEFDFVHLISHSENVGFAAACNTGLKLVESKVVIFLNSDTLIPRAGLIRLVESLEKSSDIGATAPCSNNVAYFQKVEPTYSTLQGVDLFANDFANRSAEDEDVSMLVGLCLAMRTEFMKDLGGFSTEYGKGMFEDNELSFRIQESGKRLVLSSRSYIHHKGSQSLQRLELNPAVLLRQNEKIFLDRHLKLVRDGYASHLPGERREPIHFNQDRHPEAIRDRICRLAKEADISLCMIVRDEERVLDSCLSSVADVFSQKIIVDTGSTDRTVEIAKEHGAEVYDIEWPDSFAQARNESLKYAKGKWIFWLDADDTLPIETAEQILQAAIHAPDHVHGFVVPVQFVDGPDGQGTRVDHVKLFRNLPGLEFEGRIHEQILGSLRKHGCEIQRINAVVLHSGYDTSEVGQAKKKKRDSKLLLLDLQDRPNHPFVLFNLGMTAHYNGDHAEAIDWFRKCLDVSIPEESHVRKVFALLSASLRAIGLQQDSVTVLSDGLRHYSDDPELLFLRGVSFMNAGRYGEARLDLERIPEGTPRHFASFDTGIQNYKKHFNLGVCCKELGDYAAMRHYLIKAVESGSAYAEPAEVLFDSALKRRDFIVGEEVVSLVEVKDNRGEFWGSLLLRLLNAQGADAPSVLSQKQAMNPHDKGIGILLSKCLLERGRLDEAEPILFELCKAGIPDASFFMGVTAANNNDCASASAFFEEALRLNPNHSGAKMYLEKLKMKSNGSNYDIKQKEEINLCGC
ncbi:MAG: glycosyltransferase [Fimbriimonadaceae bacterium]|nr:MAG: glycosyltransferase [Fimbriimonadaceae bacterium]